MLLARALLFTLACSGCTRPAPPDRAPTGLKVERVWSAVLPALRGISGATVDGLGRPALVPERDRTLYTAGSSLTPTAFLLAPIRGVPEGLDLESLARLDADHLAFGTESQVGGRKRDPVLIARQSGSEVVVESELELSYEPFGLEVNANAGIEALCATERFLLAGLEPVIVEAGRRLAPVGIYARAEKKWTHHALALTTGSGKLAALECREAAGALEVAALERHYEVMRLLLLELPVPAPRVLEPKEIADLRPLFPEQPNLEALAFAASGGVFVVSDNAVGSNVQGPTLIARLTLSR